jgi:hypothetical protein
MTSIVIARSAADGDQWRREHPGQVQVRVYRVDDLRGIRPTFVTYTDDAPLNPLWAQILDAVKARAGKDFQLPPHPQQVFDWEDIAQVTHEANRAVQKITGDPQVSEMWSYAPEWQRDSAVDGVQHVVRNGDVRPRDSHQNWLRHKQATGWVYGPVKDEATKQHPCVVPYEALPPEQRAKDAVFHAVVNALRPYLKDAA